jgi:hypothetical protein
LTGPDLATLVRRARDRTGVSEAIVFNTLAALAEASQPDAPRESFASRDPHRHPLRRALAHALCIMPGVA